MIDQILILLLSLFFVAVKCAVKCAGPKGK